MKRACLVLGLCLAGAGVWADTAAAVDTADSIIWYRNSEPLTVQLAAPREPVVQTALEMLSADLLQVTGQPLQVIGVSEGRAVPGASANGARPVLQVVQLGDSRRQHRWLRAWGVPVDSLLHRPDAFFVKLLADGPADGASADGASADGASVQQPGRLLVVGADARGTAYGLLEVSRLAGVSPWVWWGDCVPLPQAELRVVAGFESLQRPSVALRGIFLNDEDWSLRPWSWGTFAPAPKGCISAATYRQVFRLLLRLRANLIWPAMHEGTTSFYQVPGAMACADSCGMVVGTSHCEPLLRSNTGEWDKQRRGAYNYISNKEQVLQYWTERLQEAGGYRNCYTLGMRGIHDGSMEGVSTPAEKLDGLQRVLDDQRDLLQRFVLNNKAFARARGYRTLADIPQAFVPYKEVLQIYEAGLRVPDDVTLIWCDDNYGYLTRLSDSLQQLRAGGAGVYYHLSYWGRPMDYLWLTTTQPGLIYEEMRQAFDHQARREWVVNVHDPKVAAYDLEFFLDLAWNIDHVAVRREKDLVKTGTGLSRDSMKTGTEYGRDSVTVVAVDEHLQQWLNRQFGADAGKRLFPLMHEFYRLTAIRKPEFMGWNQVELDRKKYPRGRSAVTDTEFLPDEAWAYLKAFGKLREEACKIGRNCIPARLQDAYFAAVVYPLSAASYMAEKMLYAQMARQRKVGLQADSIVQADSTVQAEGTITVPDSLLYAYSARSLWAHHQIEELTHYYNDSLAQGKWKGLLSARPRDLFQYEAPSVPVELSWEEVCAWKEVPVGEASAEAMKQAEAVKPAEAVKQAVPSALTCDAAQFTSATGPVTVVQNLGHSQRAVVLPPGESLVFEFQMPQDAVLDARWTVGLIPTQPNDKGDLRFSVRFDEGEEQIFSLKEPYRSEGWKQNVLRGQARRTGVVQLAPGVHRLVIKALDPHVVVDEWRLDWDSTAHKVPYMLSF